MNARSRCLKWRCKPPSRPKFVTPARQNDWWWFLSNQGRRHRIRRPRPDERDLLSIYGPARRVLVCVRIPQSVRQLGHLPQADALGAVRVPTWYPSPIGVSNQYEDVAQYIFGWAAQRLGITPEESEALLRREASL